ncbi:hypothetical protein ACIOUE_13010 [Streptomyces xanthochromogenes]|uniref:hypothetical protein n=1 Tax=Streptomyces xanthochromogenes TaxID=67384 RepID=UPI0037FD15B8
MGRPRARGSLPSVRTGPLRTRARRAGWAARRARGCVRRVYLAGRFTGRWQERLRRLRR